MNKPPPSLHEQPLIEIPEAHAKIYSNFLIVSKDDLCQLQTTDTGQFLSDLEVSLSCTSNSPGKQRPITNSKHNHIIIKFDNPDYAFNVLQHQKIIQIHNITQKSIQYQLKVESEGILFTVQALLRRKMCEMGFQRRYDKIKKLGSGATAQVHLVCRKSDGKKFAAKMISIKDSSEKAYETFLNETKLLRLIQHKNIVLLESLYVQKKHLIMVLEYLDGGTLLSSLKNGEIRKQKQKWAVIKDLTEALEHLRQKRIVHRDLKMENIMIRKGPNRMQYVLTDFGLACWTGKSKPLFERCGTPGYIAPEVLRAEKGFPVLDHRIDVFSLGVVAHLVFLLQPLFQYSGNVKQLLKANKIANFSLDQKKYLQLSASQYEFLECALRIDMNQRPTAQVLLQSIESFTYETPKKRSQQKSHQKQFRMQMKQIGVDVKLKKAASLTKKNISLNISRKEISAEKRTDSAKKFFGNIWSSFISPRQKPKSISKMSSQNFKIKQNSLEKHKNLRDFFE